MTTLTTVDIVCTAAIMEPTGWRRSGCQAPADVLFDRGGVYANIGETHALPVEVFNAADLAEGDTPRERYVALCAEHRWYAPGFARFHPHKAGPPKLMVEGRQWNMGDVGIVIVGSIYPGVDWAVYIGAQRWVDGDGSFEMVQDHALAAGQKLPFEDAGHYFPELAHQWPEGYRS